MAAALKFFLGQDAAAAGDDEDSDDEDAAADGEKGKKVVVAPTKEEVYKATHKVCCVTLLHLFVILCLTCVTTGKSCSFGENNNVFLQFAGGRAELWHALHQGSADCPAAEQL
jgi:hypothetical protein